MRLASRGQKRTKYFHNRDFEEMQYEKKKTQERERINHKSETQKERTMTELIFKRRRRDRPDPAGQTVVRVDNEAYIKALDVADETGLSVKEVVSRMVGFAYEHVRYETEDLISGQ